MTEYRKVVPYFTGTTRLWERQWLASGTVMLRRWVRLDQRAGGERAAELIAAPWPGEREIFSFGNMASRSSARLENLPLTRNVVAKLSAPDDDKEDGRSFDASKGKNSRSNLGDKLRDGSSCSGGRRFVEREVMHVGVGELYCEAAIFENMNHRDHISDTAHVDRRPAPSQYAAPAPPQHSAIYTSAPRLDVDRSIKTPVPPPSHFATTTPSNSHHNPNAQVIVPTDREHVSWNEFQAINKGVPRERIQEVWKTTPWFKTPDPNRFANVSASDRVSWNDFQRILKGKDKQEIRNLWYEYGQGRYHVDASLRSNLDTSAADDESAHATKRQRESE